MWQNIINSYQLWKRERGNPKPQGTEHVKTLFVVPQFLLVIIRCDIGGAPFGFFEDASDVFSYDTQ